MALIKDVFSAADAGASDRAKRRQAAVAKIKQMHQATIIPTLTMEPVKRMYTERIAAPAVSRYKNFRPHPLLVKHQQEKARAEQAKARQPTPAKRPGQTMDGMTPVRVRKQPPQAAPAQLSDVPQPAVKPDRPATKRRAKVFDFVQYPLIAAAAVGAAYSTNVGQAIIGIYFLLAIIFKIRSQITFGAALLLLISIPFFQVIHLTGTSENAAVYSFEMLVVGTIQAMIELWRSNRKARGVAPSS